MHCTTPAVASQASLYGRNYRERDQRDRYERMRRQREEFRRRHSFYERW